ncbi:unnamed protein product [Microthlaspi erraticum]|uniref:Uncharacterized protein n=1 Tax=Microthlaspi erraticum TaxID=1685480 RepID=A0A6D2IXZ9_9BRAS|nr:unnamed protein product [Microthlaspi erraticum]
MDSSTTLSPVSVTREEFNAFHKSDRALFTRLVFSLKRDINQSCKIVSFLLYLEKNAPVSNLVVNLAALPDYFVNALADEVVTCLTCMCYETFPNFVATFGKNIKFFTIPLIMRMTGESLSLAVIHQNRQNILLAVKTNLTRICYPAFEDICVRAAMHNKETEEREKAVEKMSNLAISKVVHKGEQETAAGASTVDGFSDEEQVMAENRTVFLTFSKGYPIAEAEVHGYFTRRFGDIIEAIYMPGVEGNEQQALYARMVLHSAAKIPEIVTTGITRTKYTINGKHVWARKFIPNLKAANNVYASVGVSL